MIDSCHCLRCSYMERCWLSSHCGHRCRCWDWSGGKHRPWGYDWCTGNRRWLCGFREMNMSRKILFGFLGCGNRNNSSRQGDASGFSGFFRRLGRRDKCGRSGCRSRRYLRSRRSRDLARLWRCCTFRKSGWWFWLQNRNDWRFGSESRFFCAMENR